MGDFDGRGNAPSSRLSLFLWIEWHASIISLEEEPAIPAAAAAYEATIEKKKSVTCNQGNAAGKTILSTEKRQWSAFEITFWNTRHVQYAGP